jgi:hypothetical protein
MDEDVAELISCVNRREDNSKPYSLHRSCYVVGFYIRVPHDGPSHYSYCMQVRVPVPNER